MEMKLLELVSFYTNYINTNTFKSIIKKVLSLNIYTTKFPSCGSWNFHTVLIFYPEKLLECHHL